MGKNGVTAPEGYITRADLARKLGCSRTAVINAIKEGKIPEAIILQQGKHSFLHEEKAIKFWQDSGFSGRGNYNPNLHKRLAQTVNVDDAQIKSKIAAGSARDATALLDFKMKSLEYKKMLGELVERDKVDKALFAIGDEIKSAFLAMPGRVVDELIAMQGNRHGIILRLESEIREVLLKITDAPARINQVMNNEQQ